MISSYCRIMSWWAEKGGVRCNSEVVFGALASTPKLARKRKRLGARKRGCERRANTINSSDTTSVKNYQTWIITHCTFFENPPKNSKIEKKLRILITQKYHKNKSYSSKQVQLYRKIIKKQLKRAELEIFSGNMFWYDPVGSRNEFVERNFATVLLSR